MYKYYQSDFVKSILTQKFITGELTENLLKKAVTHKLCPFLLTGLMTDMLGSYTVTFYTAGVILIVGASITSLMACVKQQPKDADEEILETPSYGEKLLVTEKVTAV